MTNRLVLPKVHRLVRPYEVSLVPSGIAQITVGLLRTEQDGAAERLSVHAGSSHLQPTPSSQRPLSPHAREKSDTL